MTSRRAYARGVTHIGAMYSCDRGQDVVKRSRHFLGVVKRSSSIPGQGGVTHIGAVYIAVTGVKMWSNGQDTFLGVVKRSSSIPGPILPLIDR